MAQFYASRRVEIRSRSPLGGARVLCSRRTEPRQVRKEAAIRCIPCVTQFGLGSSERAGTAGCVAWQARRAISARGDDSARPYTSPHMSYQALARKYRPQTFGDIVGQETTVQTLQNAIENDRIHHAYLFSGVRGVGKTTLARILAKALNCAHGPTKEPDNTCVICREITEGIDMDVREIDAATYTGVDNVRELRDVTQFQPARDRYRIFIIDEAQCSP